MAQSFLARMAAAMVEVEGFYPGSRAYRNNNPGNLRDYRKPSGEWAIWPGLAHDAGGFAIFPTAAAGWAALERDLGLKAGRGMTLAQAITMYAPPSENDTAAYIARVSADLGVSPNASLAALAASAPAAGGGAAAPALEWPKVGEWLSEDEALGAAAVVAGISAVWLLVA